MSKVLIMLKVHQPHRINEYSFFDLGKHYSYFNEGLNKIIIDRVADQCYLPTNRLLEKLIDYSDGELSINLSISGTTLEQLYKYRPDALESFIRLAETKRVEFLGETYHHSLSFFYSKEEFKQQIRKHNETLLKYFDQTPASFVNTEFTYNNEVAKEVRKLGFKNILSEGVDWILNKTTPNQVFKAKNEEIQLFLRNHLLSNDIGYRFSDKNWSYYPLTPEKFHDWMIKSGGELINLFIDYEAFGEHHKKESGILKFFEKLIRKILKDKKLHFSTFDKIDKMSNDMWELDIPQTISWADHERDLSAWRGNAMQYESLMKIYELENEVKELEDLTILETWRNLQTSDHFYYMSTKGFTDGQAHNYFSPFLSPYDAYRYYMNVLSDFEIKIRKKVRHKLTV